MLVISAYSIMLYRQTCSSPTKFQILSDSTKMSGLYSTSYLTKKSFFYSGKNCHFKMILPSALGKWLPIRLFKWRVGFISEIYLDNEEKSKWQKVSHSRWKYFSHFKVSIFCHNNFFQSKKKVCYFPTFAALHFF